MKKLFSLALAAALCLSAAACGTTAPTEPNEPADPAEKTYVVGICQLVQHDALDAATQGFKDALVEELGDAVTFEEQNASNDIPTCGTICSTGRRPDPRQRHAGAAGCRLRHPDHPHPRHGRHRIRRGAGHRRL